MVVLNQKKRKKVGLSQYRSPKIFIAAKEERRKPKEREPFWPKLKIILLLLVIVGGIYFIFASPIFQLKQILVEGNRSIPQQEIESNFRTGANVLLINSKDFEDYLITKYPQIQNVQIYKGIPDAIKIVIFEKELKAIWETNGIKYFLSNHGEITKLVDEGITSLPLVVDKQNLPVSPGDIVASPNFIAFITNANENLNKEAGINPVRYEIVETTFDVNLYTDAGFYIKLNSLRSSKKQLDNLKKVLAEKRSDIHEYVDLRIDGWAYYK